ncbi:TIGR03960 family B12-binding radical SAM protein [Fusibacter sp. JL298sf-3]
MNLEALLRRVEKPTRYIGDEMNTFNKPLTEELIRFCFAFPDVYEVGMSHLGMQIIYRLLNGIDDVFCERVFAPWTDMEALMRERKVPLFTLESKSPVGEVDILGFTLQYELSYTNILNMMDLSGIPLLAAERDERHPLIVAGGPCAYNPEPLADIVDMFLIGEGEELNVDFIDLYRTYKRGAIDRETLFEKAMAIEGVYVPKFYRPVYGAAGVIETVERHEKAPERVKKRIVKDFDKGYCLDSMIVPFNDIVHDRAMLELFRGCTKGCRFCQAGMLYRPIRERSEETLVESIDKILSTTGYEELSLTSLSTLDYSRIKPLVKTLVEKYEKDNIGVSLPSLRLDSFSVDVLKEIQKVKKTGLTFAPEAGTQRLRDVINKGVTAENIQTTFESIFSLGWHRVKLYFMIGLPTETFEDLDGINDIGNLATYLFKQNKPENMKKSVQATVSTSCFVPKPFTPFQWMRQDTIEEFREKIAYLRQKITNKKLVYNYHDPETSILEGVFARGDRRLGAVLIEAYKNGCRFDGWQEYFDFDQWMAAFDKLGVDPAFYTHRQRAYDEVLPWDVIDPGVSKAFLQRENEKARNAEVTEDCRETCTGCGVNVNIVGGAC